MEVKAITKYAKISAFKAREVSREVQGLLASDALDVLKFSAKKAARLIEKTLKSAIANAENNANLKVAGLYVKEAVIGEGPTIKRMRPKARGSAGPILKRTSHVRVVLTDEAPAPVKEKKPHVSKNKGEKQVGKKQVAKAADNEKKD